MRRIGAIWIVWMACGGAPAPAPTPKMTDPTTTAAATPARPALPDSPAGRHAAWLLDVLDHNGAAPAEAFAAHFAPDLLAKLPPERATKALGALAPYLAGAVYGAPTSTDATNLALHGKSAAGRFALVIALDPATQRIALFDVVADPGPRPKSIDEAIAQLREQAPRAQLLVAELRDGACIPRHAFNADAELAIASQSKLYVLLAVADHIKAGRAKWTDEVALRDGWRSHPEGIVEGAAAGAKFSLAALATQAISVSDNTANDYLLNTVGRARVEAAQRTAQHAHPARNEPWLGTRELFWFKLAMTTPEVDRYFAGPVAQRRQFLDGIADKLAPNDNNFWTDVREIDRVEWFATGLDLGRLAAALQVRVVRDATLRDILGKHSALEPALSKPWRFVGFKGGNEPGVLGATWILQRDDDRWFVVHIGLNAARAPSVAGAPGAWRGAALDEGLMLGTAYGVLELLAADRAP